MRQAQAAASANATQKVRPKAVAAAARGDETRAGTIEGSRDAAATHPVYAR
jgi:hypothetical protein